MPKLKIAIIAILAIVIVFQAANYIKNYSGKTGPAGPAGSASQSNDQNLPAGLEAQTNSEGPISVQVTPLEPSQDKWKFEVFLNTHSVELDYDLTELAVLTDDSGNEYKPSGWEGDPPGGHHRSGILIFDAINPRPDSMTLKIREIGGIGERNFVWTTAP